MKRIIYIIIFLFSICAFSQELMCCKTASEVKTKLEGSWKIKGDNSKILYKFWFEDNSGIMDRYKETDKKNEYTFFTCPPFVEILIEKGIFKIEFVGLAGSSIRKIYVLNENSLILGDGKTRIEYLKVIK